MTCTKMSYRRPRQNSGGREIVCENILIVYCLGNRWFDNRPHKCVSNVKILCENKQISHQENSVQISSAKCRLSFLFDPHLINPLRAKFVRGNIKIYLHVMSFPQIGMSHVVEILPQVRQGTTYSTYSISWLLMSWRRNEPGHQQPAR